MVSVLSAPSTPPLSWYQVPPDLKELLWAAAAAWQNEALADRSMAQALTHPEASLDVLVSAYRYFFYRHNDPMARQIAEQVLRRVSQAEHLPENWAILQPLLRQRRTDPPIRLYLSAYSALGMILARLGDLEAAGAIATQLQTIDDDNEFGANLMLSILSPEEDDDD
jgi:hypothetical protein